jgi:hypothetical protein
LSFIEIAQKIFLICIATVGYEPSLERKVQRRHIEGKRPYDGISFILDIHGEGNVGLSRAYRNWNIG